MTRRNKKHAITTTDTLAAFDDLPDVAYVRQPVVEILYACSHATIWRGVNAGRIPRPRKLSPRVTAWSVGELRHALRPDAGGNTEGSSDAETTLVNRLKRQRKLSGDEISA